MKANLLCYELNLLQNLNFLKFIWIRLGGALLKSNLAFTSSKLRGMGGGGGSLANETTA